MNLSQFKDKPPFSILTWLYRLIQLPSRFHQLNDQFWNLVGQTQTLEIASQERQKRLENLESQTSLIRRDLEMIHYALKQKAGLLDETTVKEIAGKEFTSETYPYFAFENQFRGSSEEIQKIQSQYLEFIRQAKSGSKGEFLLDVGCGRGEFLALLKENIIPARGVDTTTSMVESCKQRGLDAALMDTLQYLKAVREGSLIGITAFQVVEHLPVNYLIELIQASAKKIASGGLLLLETVNPASFSSLRNFYLDLTHKNPIPPPTLKFLLENSGFKNVTIRFTSPIPDHLKLQGNDENTKKLNELLFGPQDYAVLGWV